MYTCLCSVEEGEDGISYQLAGASIYVFVCMIAGAHQTVLACLTLELFWLHSHRNKLSKPGPYQTPAH